MNQKGFSLVELLVAMTIFSMMSLIAFSAFSFFADRWEGNVGKFDDKLRSTRTQLVLLETLQQLVPYEILDNESVARIFFEGNRNGFVSMSQQSITEPDSLAVVRLSIRQREDFTFELIYEEWPLRNVPYISIAQNVQFSDPIVLQGAIKEIRFQYFGMPETRGISDTQLQNVRAEWWDEYNSFITNTFPENIAIQWTDAQNDEHQLYLNLVADVMTLGDIPENSPYRPSDEKRAEQSF